MVLQGYRRAFLPLLPSSSFLFLPWCRPEKERKGKGPEEAREGSRGRASCPPGATHVLMHPFIFCLCVVDAGVPARAEEPHHWLHPARGAGVPGRAGDGPPPCRRHGGRGGEETRRGAPGRGSRQSLGCRGLAGGAGTGAGQCSAGCHSHAPAHPVHILEADEPLARGPACSLAPGVQGLQAQP